MIRLMIRIGFVWAIFIGALLTAGAFVRFVELLPHSNTDLVTRTDAVVVLTGGPDRVREGIDLMYVNVARRMFISGVGPNVTRTSIMHSLQPGSAIDDRLANLFACCVDLGLAAENTAGNAIETAEWMAANGHKSLRLVTAFWHIPRSLVEFRRRLPDVEIVPHPVFSANVSPENWATRPRTALLLAGEFSKYVFARLRAKTEREFANQIASVAVFAGTATGAAP